ncbi:hypothetical protein FGG08_001395 [Glutinoglossum americanum]|uniref:Fanconi-associated nuclease n=1 Tax=Glutinoglossum americanum TaxID=1670608 RepID=A0A9P8L6A3_9PEZI|nr:hypothetical protein FGG08_001395 [Glutinoglossum americanum]
MLGKQIKHPPSTNFDTDDDSHPVKRLKRAESSESLYLSDYCGAPRDDLFAPGNDDALLPSELGQTSLEAALPSIRTDKEAIEEYEAAQAADMQERSGQQNWVKGKSSIYVDAFNLALETVLEDEAYLFNEVELATFANWRQLNYEAQYLYVRLFLRKTSAWHRINRLGYYSDIADLPAAVQILLETRQLPPSSPPAQQSAGELGSSEDITLGFSFTFADRSEDKITTLEEASSLLQLDELKAIAKEAKVNGRNKQELIKALQNASKSQRGLSWGDSKNEDIKSSTRVNGYSYNEGSDESNKFLAEKGRGIGVNRDDYFVRKILLQTGSCIRLSIPALRLFERVHLVFYRSTEWTEKSLTTIILSRISRRNFPDYIVSRSANVFPSRSVLIEFETAIRTQSAVDNILESNGVYKEDGFQKVIDLFEVVYPRWKLLLGEEQRKEDCVYTSGEGAYLRRFSPAWVYTRIVHKAAYVLGRLKSYRREHELLTELLSQRLFHSARRGAWYQRKALIEEHYMAAIFPSCEGDAEADKKQWKRVALRTCESGLEDNGCHLIYHYDLQKRITKLERALKVVKREQHDFGHVLLSKAAERVVRGVQILKDGSTEPRTRSESVGPLRGTQTIWLDQREGGGECRVEAMCLSWYRDQGWKGYHSEGGIVRTLFAYLFYDILFLYIPNVFQTSYQTCPLDLHTDTFYSSRASEINRRLIEISNGGAERLITELDERGREMKLCVVGLDWDFEKEDLLEIVKCFNGEALAMICKVMAQEYRQRGGGIPDLFLWNPETKDAMFVEVKSENDRLSDTQRLWIHVLTSTGVRVELCNAVATEVRPAE